MRAVSAWAIAAALAVPGMAARATEAPELKLPDGAQAQVVAGDMVVNGGRSRVVRFRVEQSEAQVLEFFRREFGAQHVVNTVQGRPVIGSRVGDHYHTVRLEPIGERAVAGTVMTTQLSGGPVRSAVGADTERVLPADSRVLSRMQSEDGGRRALLVTAVNRNGLRANRDHVVQALSDRGFKLVREDAAPVQGHDATSLVLASGAEEAVVTVVDIGRYRSVVIQRTRESR